jgi:hypothetical protein
MKIMLIKSGSFQSCIISLGLGLILAATAATPSALTKSRTHIPGHSASAQSIEGDIGSDAVSSERTTAIRACTRKASSWSEYAWGVTQSAHYRACMFEYGQPE